MANFVVAPNFEKNMRKLETKDPAHADVLNALFQQLINNDAYLFGNSDGFSTVNIASRFGVAGGFKLDSNGKPLKNAANDAIDDAPKIQEALNWARDRGGAALYLPPAPNGTAYAIKSKLVIYSNTTLILDSGATIVRNATLPYFFVNGESSVNYYGYNGHKNITISGGTLEGNSDNFEHAFNFISIGHGKNIKISDMNMLNILTYHAIEMNSSKDVLIENCIFDGYRVDKNHPDQGRRSEAVQLDGAFSPAVFGAFGAYDNTPCNNVLVTGCTFRNWDRGVGSHTGFTGKTHENIKIVNNHFEDLTGEPIISCMWNNVVIEGNTFDKARKGVYLRIKDSTDIVRNYVISNNVFREMVDMDTARHAIHINGGNNQIEDVTINGNVFYNCTQTFIYCSNVKRITVGDNTLDNSSAGGGIYFIDSSQITISDNAINNVNASGIFLENSTGSVVNENNIANCNKNAIALSTNSKDNNISDNIMRAINRDNGDYHFISVTTGSDDNLFIGNIARGSRGSSNLGSGIRISSLCSGNAVFNNSFKSAGIDDNGNSTMANNV